MADGDLRDVKAIQRLASGYLKLLFPDLNRMILDRFETYCLHPATQLRGNIRRQMSMMDAEYSPRIAPIEIVP